MYRPTASSIRKAFPTCSAVGRWVSISSEKTSASIRVSNSSGSLKPSREKNLMPLSSNGLWEAEMTTPASARRDRVIKAIPGVGSGPTSSTSPPMEQMPEVRALSSM
jgi:hypothetical protein